MALNEIAKSGDTVECTCNTDGFVTGIWNINRPSLKAANLGVVLVGDTCVLSCGHTARATTGSTKSSKNGIAIHRAGDAVEVIEGGSGITVVSTTNKFKAT